MGTRLIIEQGIGGEDDFGLRYTIMIFRARQIDSVSQFSDRTEMNLWIPILKLKFYSLPMIELAYPQDSRFSKLEFSPVMF